MRAAIRPGAVLAAVFGLAAWSAASCGPRRPAPSPETACAPVDGRLPAGARADALAGEFRLTLVVTRGAHAGESTTGTLRLQPFGGRPVPVRAAEGVRYPLFGGAEVDLAAVGAVAPGDIGGVDAARPGVLVMEWPRAHGPAGAYEISLRFGADANQAGPDRFDGTYLSLFLTSLSADGFAGGWESGGGQPVANGYFCAERTGAGCCDRRKGLAHEFLTARHTGRSSARRRRGIAHLVMFLCFPHKSHQRFSSVPITDELLGHGHERDWIKIGS